MASTQPATHANTIHCRHVQLKNSQYTQTQSTETTTHTLHGATAPAASGSVRGRGVSHTG
eukprot:3732121-Prymnesium_polylepis.2